MRCLDFAREFATVRGRRIRELRFDERSTLPIPAACVIANGVRETLSRLLGSPVALRLIEPSLPSVQGWNAIADGARIFRARGLRSEAALLVRPRDALVLAGAAFGEEKIEARDLSSIESTVLARIVRACGPHLAPIVGTDVPLECGVDVAGFTTYFEIVLDRPVRARLGIALANDPHPDPVSGVTLEMLMDLELDVVVRSGEVRVAAGVLAALEPGAFVPISHARRFGGVAYLAGSPLGRGECGVHGGRYALSFGVSETKEGSSAPSL